MRTVFWKRIRHAHEQGAKLRDSTNVFCFGPRTNTTKEENRGVYTVGVEDRTGREEDNEKHQTTNRQRSNVTINQIKTHPWRHTERGDVWLGGG